MKESRKEKRETATGSVTYAFTANDFEKMSTGLLSNLSEAGVCLYTQECITDKKVKIYLNGIIADPMKAEVMWCNEANSNLYMVGLRLQN